MKKVFQSVLACFWIVILTKFDQTKQQPARLAAACQGEHGSSLQTVSIERILRERADVPLLRVLQRRKRKKKATQKRKALVSPRVVERQLQTRSARVGDRLQVSQVKLI